MSGLDIDEFISSRRAKLAEEKSRLDRRARVKGILPSDSVALERTDQLRRERQQEYKDHMRKRAGVGSHTAPPPSNKTIAEIRRNMSRERERELIRNEAELVSRRDKDYASLKERKRAEERQYQGTVYDHPYQAQRQDRDTIDHQHSRVSFENDPRAANPPKHSSWDEEEDRLMEWTRNQAHPAAAGHAPRDPHRARTPPPPSDAPHMDRKTSRHTLRSISAPSVAGAGGGGAVTGIAALGRQEDMQTKRQKQLKYAEELRSQMKEKEGGSSRAQHQRTKEKDAPRRYNSYSGGQPTEAPVPAPKVDNRRRGWDSPGHHQPQEDVQPPPRGHHHHEQFEEEERRTQKYPPQRRGGYYYPEAFGPPPPPPPRFQGGYGRWGVPYHPYPPPPPPPHDGVGYEHDPYYYPPYHPGSRAAYAPPPQPRRPSHPPDRFWDDQDGGDYERGIGEGRDLREAKKPRHAPQQSKKEPGISGGTLGMEDSPKMDKEAYRRELEGQMREKRERDKKEKLAKESYDKQVDRDIYDPFGKGGCGAPVRDQFGNLVADLKQMRKINENRLSNNSPMNQPRASKEENRREASTSPPPQQATILTYDKMNDENAKKATQESYRDYLRQQVREKEEMKRKEKEQQKLEEERVLVQLEKDRKRLQEEYQQELERQRRKEEEARNKNEAIKREAEIKRQMAIMQREQELMREEAERRALIEKRQSLESASNPNLRLPQERKADSRSPPVPTLRHKMKKSFSQPPPPATPDHYQPQQANPFRSSSPPIPTLRKKQQRASHHVTRDTEHQVESAGSGREATDHRPQDSTDPVVPDQESTRVRRLPAELPPKAHITEERAGGAEQMMSSSPVSDQNKLLSQLGAIRMHLQAELAKHGDPQAHYHPSIFDRAKQQKPKIAAPKFPRPREPPSSHSALHEFSKLKSTDPARRGKFLEEFPELPDSDSALELQQRALLRHQREQLDETHREPAGEFKTADAPMLSTQTTQVLRNPFADDVSRLSIGGCSPDSPQRPYQQPRRQWDKNKIAPPSPGGRSKASINTMEVDNMAARNEERLRRLEAILNAEPRRQDSGQSSFGNVHSQGSSRLTVPVPPRNTLSRQSELSLDCDIQHLPA